MEAIKFAMMYSLEVIVVGLFGVTLLAGLYQLIRDQLRQHDNPTSTSAQQPAQRS
jgi:hypothetical protein